MRPFVHAPAELLSFLSQGVGNILLTEWSEEHPLVLNRPGMAMRLVHYRQPMQGGGLSEQAPGDLGGEEHVVSSERTSGTQGECSNAPDCLDRPDGLLETA